MVFEEKIKEVNSSINENDLITKAKKEFEKKDRKENLDSFIKKYIRKFKFIPIDSISKVRLDLEPKRENELQKINIVYNKEILNNSKSIGRTKLIKMAIDNLVDDLNKLDSEEEQLQYLNRLKKEADF